MIEYTDYFDGGLFQGVMEDESKEYYFNGGRILIEYTDYFDGGLFQGVMEDESKEYYFNGG